jgi:hypothetical protein
LGANCTRHDAKENLRLPPPRILRAHPEVSCERQFAAAAKRIAGDRGDDRLGNSCDRVNRRAQWFGIANHVCVTGRGELFDIRPGGEDLIAAIDDDCPHRIITADLSRGRPHPVRVPARSTHSAEGGSTESLPLEGRLHLIRRRPPQ